MTRQCAAEVGTNSSLSTQLDNAVLEAHLRTCLANAVEERDGQAAVQEMVDVLPQTVRR